MAKDTKIIQGNSILENSPPKGPGREGLYLEGTFKNQSRGFYLSRENLSKHLLLLGSTGSGKTNVFYRLLAQIKKNLAREDLLVIFDSKGDYLWKFYQPGDQIISNFRDLRGKSLKWNIYKEILVDGWEDDQVYTNAYEISHSLFQEALETSGQKFFPNAAKDLFTAILVAQIRLGKDDLDFRKKYFNNQALRYFLDSLSEEKLKNLLDPGVFPDLSSVLMYLGDFSNSQALGVIAEVQAMSHQVLIGEFAKNGRFSARDFVRNEGGKTLFIDYDLGMGESLGPIYRLLIDLSLKEALSRKKSGGNIYFVFDEFKLIPRLKHIDDGLNFGRSLGVKILAGLQTIDQIYSVYGKNRGVNLMAGFSNIISFKLNDFTSKDYISNLYGKNLVLDQYKTSTGLVLEDKREGRTVESWDLTDLLPGEAIVGLSDSRPFSFKFSLYKD